MNGYVPPLPSDQACAGCGRGGRPLHRLRREDSPFDDDMPGADPNDEPGRDGQWYCQLCLRSAFGEHWRSRLR